MSRERETTSLIQRRLQIKCSQRSRNPQCLIHVHVYGPIWTQQLIILRRRCRSGGGGRRHGSHRRVDELHGPRAMRGCCYSVHLCGAQSCTDDHGRRLLSLQSQETVADRSIVVCGWGGEVADDAVSDRRRRHRHWSVGAGGRRRDGHGRRRH